jgi:hypothetical protein
MPRVPSERTRWPTTDPRRWPDVGDELERMTLLDLVSRATGSTGATEAELEAAIEEGGKSGLIALVRESERSRLRASSLSERLLGADSFDFGRDAGGGFFEALREENRVTRTAAVCRWMGVALLYTSVALLGWFSIHWLYFGQPGTPLHQVEPLEPCDDTGSLARTSQKLVHDAISTAPLWARGALVVAALQACCRKVADVHGDGLMVQLLVGQSSRRGVRVGWLAIVAGQDQNGHPIQQPSWDVACEARNLTQRQAIASAAAKLLLWHWSQPIAYLAVMGAFRCLVMSLGPVQTALAAVVALREVFYILSTLLALRACPAFLLLDLRAVWREASCAQKFMRLAMYFLCPHNFVALTLGNRFRGWRRTFLGLAAVQVIADLASCFALVYLIASDIKDRAGNSEDIDTAPLKIGYTLTAFGFMLFFGPLSVASSIEGAINKQRYIVSRVIRGASGLALFAAWATIVGLMVFLTSGGERSPASAPTRLCLSGSDLISCAFHRWESLLSTEASGGV